MRLEEMLARAVATGDDRVEVPREELVAWLEELVDVRGNANNFLPDTCPRCGCDGSCEDE